MQFHLNGFRPGDPEVHEPASSAQSADFNRLPNEVDVLIVGCGPTGLTLAAQLAAFPEFVTRIVEQKSGPLMLGQADGVACRTMEMFEAFGVAERVMAEAYWVNELSFWSRTKTADAGGSSARAASRTPRTGFRSSRMSSSTRRGCSSICSASCAILPPGSRLTIRRLIDLERRARAAKRPVRVEARAGRSRR